jgi:hypothetical protein
MLKASGRQLRLYQRLGNLKNLSKPYCDHYRFEHRHNIGIANTSIYSWYSISSVGVVLNLGVSMPPDNHLS